MSSNVLKHQKFQEGVARVKFLIISTHKMKYFWYLPKRVNFLFIVTVKEKNLNFSLSFLGNFTKLSAFSGCNIGCKLWCKHSLHLENRL